MNDVTVKSFSSSAISQLQSFMSKQKASDNETESKQVQVIKEGLRRLETATGRVVAGIAGTAYGMAQRGLHGTGPGPALTSQWIGSRRNLRQSSCRSRRL